MKKSTLQLTVFILVFLIVAGNLQAQLGTNQWQYSNPNPFGFVSYQISYADDNNALVVGEAGGIAKTSVTQQPVCTQFQTNCYAVGKGNTAFDSRRIYQPGNS